MFGRLALFLPACLVLNSCLQGVDVPESPDLEKIAAIYDSPTGTVDEASIGAAIDDAVEGLERIYGMGKLKFVIDSIEGVGKAVKDVATEDANTIRPIRGTSRVETICPGPTLKPTTDPANGSVEYLIPFEKSELQDTLWGTFNECQFFDSGERLQEGGDVEAGRSQYHGALNVYLGGTIPLQALTFESFLFRLDGKLSLPSQETELATDFRIKSDLSRIDIRAPAIGGDVVFRFGESDEQFGLQTADGSFCCELSERVCRDLAAGSCDSPEAGDREIRW